MEYLDKQNEAWKIDEKEDKEEKEKVDKKKEAGKIEEEEKEDQLIKFFSDDTIHKKVFCLQHVKSIRYLNRHIHCVRYIEPLLAIHY